MHFFAISMHMFIYHVILDADLCIPVFIHYSLSSEKKLLIPPYDFSLYFQIFLLPSYVIAYAVYYFCTCNFLSKMSFYEISTSHFQIILFFIRNKSCTLFLVKKSGILVIFIHVSTTFEGLFTKLVVSSSLKQFEDSQVK